jgi:N-acetylglucosamine kinase-like BadF-type ATPase
MNKPKRSGDYVLGVDGGNTKTIALVASLDGTILGAGRGGCGDIYNAIPDATHPDPISAALAHIEYAVRNALRAAQVQAEDLATGVFSMAGADWPEDFALLQHAMTERSFGQKIIVQNDAMALLPTASTGASVSIVCGTGAGTGARGLDGRRWHSSYWQDQAQGGGQLGQKTLEAVYRADLGIGAETTLTQRVLTFFHVQTVEELLHAFTRRERRLASNTSHLTPLLLDEADAGDMVARDIIQEHGKALGSYAQVAARRVGIEQLPFSLILSGGVFRHPSTLLADAIIERVRETSPAVQPIRSRFEPIIGVLFSALEAAGVAINDTLLERLTPTIPAPTLFSTTRDHVYHYEPSLIEPEIYKGGSTL